MTKGTYLVIEGGGSGFRGTIIADGEFVGDVRRLPIASVTPKDIVNFTGSLLCSDVAAIGVSIAGFVRPNSTDGIIEHSTNTHLPDNLPLGKLIREATKRPTVVANDVLVAGIGSSIVIPSLKHYRHYKCFNIGGGAGQCDCEYVVETDNFRVIGCSEFGHFRLDPSRFAKRCACGKIGCAEAYIGGESLRREVIFTTDALGITIPSETHPLAFLDQCFLAKEKWAVEIYQQFAFAVGLYFANFQLALQTPVFTLRGSLVEKAFHLPSIMSWIKEAIYNELPAKSWRPKFIFIPPPTDNQPKDYDAFLGAAELARRLIDK